MNSVNAIILYSSLIIAAFLIFSLFKKGKSEGLRLLLFWGMTIPIIFTTLYLVGTTIAKNQSSATGGPVHWHADYEIFVCGENEEVKGVVAHAEINVKDPTGLSGRIGTPEFHEHGDKRIHVEGTVKDLKEITLAKFFASIGGQMTQTFLRVPTNEGEFIIQNGMNCPSGEPGKLQVFVYQTEGKTVSQKKLSNFPDYILSPYPTVPPGDCIIIEFTSEEKAKTDKICKFYEIAIDKGELRYEN